jgi:hypothetical protein
VREICYDLSTMDIGYWGWIGDLRRLFELPNGQFDSDVAPSGRIRLRWHNQLGYLQYSQNGTPWARLIPLTPADLGYLDLTAGEGTAVSNEDEARIIYNNVTGALQVSFDGGGYESFYPLPYLDLPDGAGSTVSAADEIRIIYNDTLGYLEASVSGAAYARLIPPTPEELGYLILSDGVAAPLSDADEANVIYNDTTGQLEVSLDGAAYASVDACGAEFTEVAGVSGRKTTNEYDPTWVTIGGMHFNPGQTRATGRTLRCQCEVFTEDLAADVELRFLNLTTSTVLATFASASTAPVMLSTNVTVGANLAAGANIIQIQLRKELQGTTTQNAVCDMARIKIDYS